MSTERASAALADCVVTDAAGHALRLGDAWRTGPGLLVFLRQFGCVACAMQVAELAPKLDLLADLGVRTVFVGNGPVEALAPFVARSGLGDRPVTVTTDPTHRAYRAAGMVRSVWGTWGPPGWPGFAQGIAAGHTNRLEGDTSQQGGALLVDREGAIRFVRRTARLGEIVSGNELVDTAMRLAAERARALP